MSDWNSTENRLRTWVPRQPSPEIRQAIFGPGRAEASPGFADVVRWVAPALGCLLLAISSLDSHLPGADSLTLAATNHVMPPHSATLREGTSLPLGASGPGRHSGVNSVPCRSVEWVMGARASAARPASILISDTNTLIQ